MALPFAKTKQKDDFSQLNKLIYGFPKTGKTTLASMMKSGDKEPLFITTEDGHGAIEVYAQSVLEETALPDQKEKHWKKFLRVRDFIVKNREEIRKSYSCIVIDLVSDLDDMATDYILKKFKVSALADLEWGKGWTLQHAEFKDGITPLFDVLPVVFITHSREKDWTYNGEKVKIQAPTMSSRCFDYVNGKVDLIGWIVPAGTKNDKPYLTFRPSKMAIAGSRFNFLATKDFELNYMDMQKSYTDVAEYFKTNVGVVNGK